MHTLFVVIDVLRKRVGGSAGAAGAPNVRGRLLRMVEAYERCAVRVLTMQAGQAEVDELLDMCTHFEHASSAIHALAVDCRVQQFVANPLVQVRRIET